MKFRCKKLRSPLSFPKSIRPMDPNNINELTCLFWSNARGSSASNRRGGATPRAAGSHQRWRPPPVTGGRRRSGGSRHGGPEGGRAGSGGSPPPGGGGSSQRLRRRGCKGRGKIKSEYCGIFAVMFFCKTNPAEACTEICIKYVKIKGKKPNINLKM